MGSRKVVAQVLALGKLSLVNSMVGVVSKPSGGGVHAPVTNTSTSSNVAAASLAERQKERVIHNKI